MIECRECKYKCEYTERVCPVCGTELLPTSEEILIARRGLDRAISDKDAERILVYRHFLADMNETESQREYAKLLERADSQNNQNIDTAMGYYYKAALKNDPYSAYRYSRLVERASGISGSFWLRYSAVLGCIDSYPDVSELFSSEHKEEIAAYYRALAAACDDTDSIVNMAKRWYEGIGVERNEACAKWYLDKLVIPPISAIKLAYKLRSVRAQEPPKLVFPEYEKYIVDLANEAKKHGFDTAYFNITHMLYKKGNDNAEITLATLFAEGIGCEQNLKTAIELFEASIQRGNPLGAAYLGKEYLSGRVFPLDTELAMKHFAKAAELGYVYAYEEMGEIYEEGKLFEQNISKAIEFYDLAAVGGLASAREKSNRLKAARRQFYNTGAEIIGRQGTVTKDEAFEAFRSLAIATAMGEMLAPKLLAMCYARGFGTEKSRSTAFFWFERAVEAGDTGAYLPLGMCYSRGFGVNFSYKMAVKYLKSALVYGNPEAEKELKTLYKRRMNKMVRSLYSTAMRLIFMKKFEKAAKLLSSFESLSYPKALYTLGCLYEFGKGVPTSDKVRAAEYYERAFRGNATFGNFEDVNSVYKLIILKLIR